MKQRKNLILGILSLALLASCNGTVTEPVDTEPALSDAVPTEPQKTEPVETEPVETEPVETDPIVPESGLTDAMLDPLIDGFSGTGVFGMAVDSAYGSFQYFYSDTVAVNGDAYYFADNFEMEDPADDPTPDPDSAPLYSLYLASNASGDACSYSVTRNNELLEEVLEDSEGNPVNFAMTYSSPFGLVTADDFLEVEGEDNVFMLDPDSVVHDEFLLSASVILTGLFVPMNRKHLNRLEYVDLNFSLIVISSWDTRLFNRVLSSMCDKSPSCCMATNGFDLNASKAKELLDDPKAFASKTE